MEIKKIALSFLIVMSLITPFLLNVELTFAASANAGSDAYQLLAPIPEFGDSYNVGSFDKYVNIFIKLSITVAAILAVIFIVLGGFKYMTSESLSLKEEGKENIKNAIIGLILLSASFLILNTINPQILKFKLEIPSVSVKESPNTIIDTKTVDQPTANKDLRDSIGTKTGETYAPTDLNMTPNERKQWVADRAVDCKNHSNDSKNFNHRESKINDDFIGLSERE
jgi:hypothetical protein